MEADQLRRLRDILNAARLIVSYVRDVSPTEFPANLEKQDAIIRRIEIIGEATAHLTEETRIAIPELPFRKMRGMRNIVAHDYANVDVTVIWDVATIHAPQLIAVLATILGEPGFVAASSLTRQSRNEIGEPGDAVEEPKPFVPVFVVANDVRAIDSAIQDVIDASRNLNVTTLRQGVTSECGVAIYNLPASCCI